MKEYLVELVYHYVSIFKNMLKVLGNITIYQT